jgi:hypothetical protein
LGCYVAVFGDIARLMTFHACAIVAGVVCMLLPHFLHLF